MAREFEIIKKNNLPDEAQIKGFTFLKEPSEKDKEKRKYDFIDFVNQNEIGCFFSKRKSWAFTKGYVKLDNKVNDYVEVKSRAFILWLILLALLLLMWLLLRSCSPAPVESTKKPIFDLTPDSGAQEGDFERKSQEELQEELNKKVEEGMMNISMNLNPIFENGTSEGNLLIMNEEINRYPQIIEIYRKDTNELIYKSGLIPVGSRVEYGKLIVDLDAGQYPCIAYFNGINGETGELMGKAGAEILIIVKN